MSYTRSRLSLFMGSFQNYICVTAVLSQRRYAENYAQAFARSFVLILGDIRCNIRLRPRRRWWRRCTRRWWWRFSRWWLRRRRFSRWRLRRWIPWRLWWIRLSRRLRVRIRNRLRRLRMGLSGLWLWGLRRWGIRVRRLRIRSLLRRRLPLRLWRILSLLWRGLRRVRRRLA